MSLKLGLSVPTMSNNNTLEFITLDKQTFRAEVCFDKSHQPPGGS